MSGFIINKYLELVTDSTIHVRIHCRLFHHDHCIVRYEK